MPVSSKMHDQPTKIQIEFSDWIIYLGVAAAILKLVDLLLIESQRKKISAFLVEFWCWLEELKLQQFISYLWTKPRVLIIFFVAYAIPTLISLFLIDESMIIVTVRDLPPEKLKEYQSAIKRGLSIGFTIIFAATYFVHRRVVNLVTLQQFSSTKTYFSFLIAQFLKHALSIPASIGVVMIALTFRSLFTGIFVLQLLNTLFFSSAVLFLGVFVTETYVLLFVLILSLLWLIFLNLAIAFSKLLAFIVERSTEYSKGALMWVSALLITFGLILKGFGI